LTEDKVLHTDSDGHKVEWELDENGKRTGKIIYDRFPGVRYTYLTALDAAKKILNGEEITHCYIEALTLEALAAAEKEDKTRQFLPKGSVEIYGEKREGPVLKQPIRCLRCLIGEIDLTRLILKSDIRFFSFDSVREQTSILGSADFSSARFSGSAYFMDARFSGSAYFMDARFSGSASFSYARFSGSAYFRSASFSGSAYFRDASFSGSADFWDASFSGDADFSDANVLSSSFGNSRFEKLCDMTQMAIGEIDFGGAVFAESLKFSASLDIRKLNDEQKRIAESLERRERGEDVERLLSVLRDWRHSKRIIYSVNFENTLVQGELVCDFDDLRPSAGTPAIKPHREGKWDGARKQYAWLKEQFRKRGAYGDEDEAHWWASECARMGAKTYRPILAPITLLITVIIINLWLAAAILAWGAKSPLNHWVAGAAGSGPLVAVVLIAGLLCALPRFASITINRVVFGYGVRLKNLIWTILLVLFGFSGLFWLAIATDKLILKCKPLPFDWDYLNALYFSVITFATVGYGDVRAVGWAAGLAMVEGLLGIALNAALVVVIFRKLIR